MKDKCYWIAETGLRALLEGTVQVELGICYLSWMWKSHKSIFHDYVKMTAAKLQCPVWTAFIQQHTSSLAELRVPSYKYFNAQLLSNYFKSSFSLYEFYHFLRGDQKSTSDCWDQMERLTLPDFQLLATDSPSISPDALATNLFVWQAVMIQLMWAGPAHWHFIITCSIHPQLVEMDLKREISRGLINFLSSAYQQCLHFLPLYKTGSSYSNRLVLGYSR